MMLDVMDPLCDSWFDLLNGEISYDSQEVKVYPGDPDNEDYDHHIIIRAESETDDSNKSTFVTQPVIVIDIITVFPVKIDKSVVNNIYGQVVAKLFPTRKHALPPLTNLQITNVQPQGSSYLEEDDGTRKYYRKSTRFIHRITQTNL